MENKKENLIRCITGKYETYLSEFHLKKRYLIHSKKRRSICFNMSLINNLSQEPHEIEKIISFYYGYLRD